MRRGIGVLIAVVSPIDCSASGCQWRWPMLAVVIPHRDGLIKQRRGLRLSFVRVSVDRTGVLRWPVMGGTDWLITGGTVAGRLLDSRITDHTAGHACAVWEQPP